MLEEEKIVGYWENRAKAQGAGTVGFGNQPLAAQDLMYNERKRFILKTCPSDLKTLDYGCGIGRYADCFPKYMGVDITDELLILAKKRNPGKKFVRQKSSIPDFSRINFELFFTSTVLQHCSEDVVLKILSAVAKRKDSGIHLCLYENSDERVNSAHVKGRSPEVYVAMLSKLFKIEEVRVDSHVVHGEKHSILLVRV
jgi:SAM-dependent methyltransferase